MPKTLARRVKKATQDERVPLTADIIRSMDKQLTALAEQVASVKLPTLPDVTFVPCRRMDILLDISGALSKVQEDPDSNIGLIYRLAAFLIVVSIRPRCPIVYRGNWQECADEAVDLLSDADLSFQEVINLGTPLIAYATVSLPFNTHEVQEIRRSADFLSQSKEG